MNRRSLVGLIIVVFALVVPLILIRLGPHESAVAMTADSLAAIKNDPVRLIGIDAMKRDVAMHYVDRATNQPLDESSAWMATIVPKFSDARLVEANDFQKIIVKDTNGQLAYRGLLSVFAIVSQPTTFDGWHLVAQAYYKGPSIDLNGLERAHSCIYLRYGTRWWPPKDFDSAITAPDAVDNCLPTQPQANNVPVDIGRDVDREGEDDNTNVNYPATVRIDWDGKDPTAVHIGVQCEQGWCDVGPKRSGHSNHYKQHRRGKVKGWFDEQRLGVKDAAGTGAVPTATIGTIIPEDGLETKRFDCKPCSDPNTWVQVASVAMSQDEQKYADSFNLAAAKIGNPNKVYLRRDGNEADPAKGWQARIVNAKGAEKVTGLSVHYVGMSATDPIHVGARWHWRDADESMWVRCASGCCDINADGDSFDRGSASPVRVPAGVGTSARGKSGEPAARAAAKK